MDGIEEEEEEEEEAEATSHLRGMHFWVIADEYSLSYIFFLL